METYIIRSITCMAILLLVYNLFLEKEKMHRFNRWYLLGSLAFSCVIPFLQIKINVSAMTDIMPLNDIVLISSQPASMQANTNAVVTSSANSLNALTVIVLVYALVAFALLLRFLLNLSRLVISTYRNKLIRYPGATLVLVKNDIISYSFLHYIFISREEYENNILEKEILVHELAHVNQKHSWDILFTELLQVFYWFNPLIPFYKKSIQLNHEFLADDAVNKKYEDVHTYQSILLAKLTGNKGAALASAFNFSITKKRLLMMTKHSNSMQLLLKKLLVFPLIASAIVVFSSRAVFAQVKNEEAAPKKDMIIKNTDGPPKIVAGFGIIASTSEGVSQELLLEYNGIIAPHFYRNEKGHLHFNAKDLTKEQRAKLEAIFVKMNKSQQDRACVGFMEPFRAPQKIVPSETQFAKWQNPENYGVWVDNKKVSNEELKKYKASDFSYYSASNLAYTDQMKKNVMKTFDLKVMYKVQLDLTTNAAYDDWVKKTSGPMPLTMYYQIMSSPKKPGGDSTRARMTL